MFSCEICETFKNIYFVKHLEQLLLVLASIQFGHATRTFNLDMLQEHSIWTCSKNTFFREHLWATASGHSHKKKIVWKLPHTLFS